MGPSFNEKNGLLKEVVSRTRARKSKSSMKYLMVPKIKEMSQNRIEACQKGTAINLKVKSMRGNK
jgi:hypothetical protein